MQVRCRPTENANRDDQGREALNGHRPPVRLGVRAGEIGLRPDFDAPLPEFEPYTAAETEARTFVE